MFKKVDTILSFNNKRNFSLVTPCCNKANKDGKFVNFKNYPTHFGYCHSCGKNTMPPSIYINEKGVQFVWNKTENCFQELLDNSYNIALSHPINLKPKKELIVKHIEPSYIANNYNSNPNDNLTNYLFANYDRNLVQNAIDKYQIKSAKDGGTVFLLINRNNRIQKVKISYYNKFGKRSNKYNVPFKNDQGYLACLFGEHLLGDNKNINLVESEKTALVCSIIFPHYIWLSYGGSNGLTDAKLKVLQGKKIVIIPDVSFDAVNIINAKKQKFISLGIDATIWDMTNGKSEAQLKVEKIHNADLEDFLRDIKLNS